MLSRFLSLFNLGMRAYKVQDVRREKRVGVTAKTFQELLKKGCEKLQIDEDDVTVVLEDDGTLIDTDTFFKKLPAQTVLVFLRRGEKWGGAGALIHDALSKLYNVSKKNEIAEQIRDMLTDEGSPEKVHIISQYLELLETDPDSEYRYENEDWFEGLNKKYKTKQEVLRHNAQTRIRSYFNTAKEQIDKEQDIDSRETLTDLLDRLNTQLKKNDFHGSYFDRTAKTSDRLCDKKGWFQCEGPFDSERCDSFHTINPYASRGYRQLFGLWNLDHVIEKSREILPTLIEATKTKKKHQQINWEHVYKLLFTKNNLKLVQIGCHKKAARTQTCNIDDFLIS
ncbi:DNA fragmentation factor subunit beta-like [Mercenaria mercenaria]|uniref:DNA fragmentation factor subunit beta-like n=1 Tax=Mercenaria mercenaria TaxID=6596 RepID=UPI00234FA37A|nr:DNA fragmentation factor subunit beta-like [Mercenaria mercenaria]